MPTVPPKDDEAFLARWSRRKRTDLEIEEETLEEVIVEEPPSEELTDEELLTELDLPEPDTMKAGDDFSAFMQARVPERLRRRALRSLWLSNPALANLDELVDYGEDYTDAATVVENMQSVYEVGKGIAEKWKAQVAALAEEAENVAEVVEDETSPMPPEEAESTLIAATAPEPIAMPVEPEPEETPLPAPRHMRFAFE